MKIAVQYAPDLASLTGTCTLGEGVRGRAEIPRQPISYAQPPVSIRGAAMDRSDVVQDDSKERVQGPRVQDRPGPRRG